MEDKKFDNTNLILKNAKINILLVNNNLSFLRSIQEVIDVDNSINKIIDSTNRIINSVNKIEDEIKEDLEWLEKARALNNKVESENEMLLESLTQRIESITNKCDFTLYEEKDVEKKDVFEAKQK